MVKFYNSKEYKLWRKTILEKFNNKCVICGDTYRLTAHHLITVHNEKYKLDPNNGIALCSRHHTKFRGCLSPHNDSAMGFFVWLLKYYPKVVTWVSEQQ